MRWGRIKELFQAAADLPADQRGAWLDGQDLDPATRRQVELQLRMLDRDAEDLPSTVDRPDFEGTAEVIERYRVLEAIGEGGFGTVYRAEQLEPVQRIVALKVVRIGMDTRQVVARFAAEQQSLARMDHPNIARVFDSGTTASGRPFIAMELVEGVPITEYCERERLGVRERLALFVDVCRGVQHAHRRGVLHRDLKPSNLLVAEIDGRPLAKIIDFGLAKAIGEGAEDRLMVTQAGAFVGTPEYMSPEQADTGPADVDTRSDVYSLGVVLYELLTGRLPVDGGILRDQGVSAFLRALRERDPSRPSTRVTDSQNAADAGADDAPSPVRAALLRGDLDWITLRALQKDREARYESAGALADDVQRWLEQRPIAARPPTVRYRVGRFVARHRLALTAGAVVLATLIVGLVSSIAFAIDARDEAAIARSRLDQLYLSMSQANAFADSSLALPVEKVQHVQLRRELITRAWPGFPDFLARSAATRYISSRDFYVRTVELGTELMRLEDPSDPTVRAAIADTLVTSSIQAACSPREELRRFACAAIEHARHLEGADLAPTQPRELRLLVQWIDAHLTAGHLDLASARIVESVARLRGLALPADDPLIAVFEGRAAVIAALRGDHARALPVFERAVPRIAEAYPNSRYLTGAVAGAIRSSRATGDAASAEAYRRQWIAQLVIDGPDLQLVDQFLPDEIRAPLEDLYSRIDEREAFEAAEPVVRSLMRSLSRAELPMSSRWYAGLHMRWAANMIANQHGWALDLVRDLLVAVRPLLEGIHPRGITVWGSSYALCLRRRGDNDAHDELIRDYLARQYGTQGAGDLFVAHASMMPAIMHFLRRQGRLDEAERVARHAIPALVAMEGETAGAPLHARRELAKVLEAAGREADAVAQRESIVALHPGESFAARELGETLLHFERADAAERSFERALESDPDDRRAHARLAEIALARGQDGKARLHVESALAGLLPEAGRAISEIETRRILSSLLDRLGESGRAHEVLGGAGQPR